jgi:hypothetical protein
MPLSGCLKYEMPETHAFLFAIGVPLILGAALRQFPGTKPASGHRHIIAEIRGVRAHARGQSLLAFQMQ